MKLNKIMAFWLACGLLGQTDPARAYICDNAKFFEQCPTADPVFATIINDFKIRRDGVLINAAALRCTEPISTIPISAYTDDLVLLQALRAIYYMDLGRSNHLPWTTKTLYGWLKENLGGLEFSTTATFDHWGGQMYLSVGDTANYFVIRAKNDITREFQRKWAGPASISTMISLMMHERRHGDGSAFDHVRTCTAQKPAAPNACDQTYEETINLSPYGIQYWLNKNWISGYINVGVGCMTPTDKTAAINWMRQDINIRLNPTDSNFTNNTPPLLTDANNPPGSCIMCTGISGSSNGEPHITTLDGLYYDFQAAGDFLLASTGPSFIAQVRQQWTPKRPNVAFNKAVALRMGETRVAVFLDPTRLVVDGGLVALADGKTLSLPDGVEVSLNGNVYVVKRVSGETVRVVVADNVWVRILGGNFMDVSVSLNYAPNGRMRGLLGNSNGDVQDDIATRDGSVLEQPVALKDFYYRYGGSMNIQPEESLFGQDRPKGACAQTGGVCKNAFEAPKKPYTVKNLTPNEYKFARSVCIKTGVKSAPLLDACTLDVAVLRSPAVAKLYIGAVAPAAVLELGSGIRRVSNQK